jgi:hypothetical protein
VAGLLPGRWERHETTVTRDSGRGRGGLPRPTRTAGQVRSVITGVERNEPALAARRHRLGWRLQVTSAPADPRSLTEAVGHSREGWVLERDFPLVKDLPLGLSPWSGRQGCGSKEVEVLLPSITHSDGEHIRCPGR